jgi:hypothetical protein
MNHCSQCNVEFPDHFEFCGSCGQRLEVPSQELESAPDLYDEETLFRAREPSHERSMVRERSSVTPQLRANHLTSERGAPVLTSFSSYDEPEIPSQIPRQPLIFGFLVLLVVGVLGIAGWYWWSQQQSITQTSQSSNSIPGPATANPSTQPTHQPTSAITPQQGTIVGNADEEIKQLRARRIAATPSERLEVISALEQDEKKYPKDYRFPYELSKLSIKGTTSHHEAFELLARAAQKAIDNGQADEVLNSLRADKDGDFHKLSHGHAEWQAIEQALRNRNKGMLKVSAH